MKKTAHSIETNIFKRNKSAARHLSIKLNPLNLFGCLKNKIAINSNIIKPIKIEWEANK